MNAISTSSSTTRASATNDDSHPSVRSVAPIPGARRMRAAEPVDTPDVRYNAPSHVLPAQMGQLVTDRMRSYWNSMYQKRRGRPRSIVRSKPDRIAPAAAMLCPVRMTGRSAAPPNQSKRADRKYAPPASPPTKKYGIMNQVQWGAPVKKESDISRASPGAALLVHAPLPQADERQHAQDGGARHREGGALGEVPRRKLWVPRQPVHLGLVDEEVERIEPAERSFRVGAVEIGLHALRLELVGALARARAQLGDRPELDRVRGARLRARGLEADLEPVVAE